MSTISLRRHRRCIIEEERDNCSPLDREHTPCSFIEPEMVGRRKVGYVNASGGLTDEDETRHPIDGTNASISRDNYVIPQQQVVALGDQNTTRSLLSINQHSRFQQLHRKPPLQDVDSPAQRCAGELLDE
jgi:hypothetical protein